MNAAQFVERYGWDEAKLVCERAGTSSAYFYHIVRGYRRPSRKLAIRLVKHSHGRMRFEDLMEPAPQEWEEA
jgi:hypothetical protein